MTEADWLAATDPGPMLAFLLGKVNDRKLRLFAVACCRRIWPLLTQARSRAAVETAERVAEGSAGRRAQTVFQLPYDDVPLHSDEEVPSYAVCYVVRASAWSAARDTAPNAASEEAWAAVPGRFRDDERKELRKAAERAQAALLRCLVGNPFRPSPPLSSAVLAWNRGTVGCIAASIYEERAFERLAILGDALEEAGCADAGLLAHCRDAGPHCRGCWAVDAALGRK
jgi:hypothetical protein